MTETQELDIEQESVQEIAEDFETAFELADLVRLHKGICFGAYENAIIEYELTPEEAAGMCLPALFKDEIMEEFETQQAKKESENE